MTLRRTFSGASRGRSETDWTISTDGTEFEPPPRALLTHDAIKVGRL
jgi:hypothetical protein